LFANLPAVGETGELIEASDAVYGDMFDCRADPSRHKLAFQDSHHDQML
jgi:hypothetical protein